MADELVTRSPAAIIDAWLDENIQHGKTISIPGSGQALLKAIEETHVLAPKKSTVEMNSAGAKSIRDSMNEANFAQRARRCFEDMLEALAHKGESDE